MRLRRSISECERNEALYRILRTPAGVALGVVAAVAPFIVIVSMMLTIGDVTNTAPVSIAVIIYGMGRLAVEVWIVVEVLAVRRASG